MCCSVESNWDFTTKDLLLVREILDIQINSLFIIPYCGFVWQK